VALYCQENIPGFGVVKQVGLGDLKGRKGVYRYEQKEKAIDFMEVQEQARVTGLDESLVRRLNKMGVSKSSSRSKADVRINEELVSLKMEGVGRSSLINHQARSGFIRVFGENSESFRLLDAEVLKYIDLRRGALITEDVGWDRRKEMNLFMNDSFKDAFRLIFNYFVFDGTVGYGPYSFPAQSVILVEDAFDPRTWTSFSRADFFDNCWEKVVFSLRRRAKASFRPEDEPWFLLADDGNPKGQLSLRI
jgi:hypothetical protein